MKLLITEVSSTALAAYVQGTSLTTSVLTQIEVERALRRRDLYVVASVTDMFAGVDLRQLDKTIVASAGSLEPPVLRTLDAIHLATALEIRSELDAFVTYDGRLADAARALRLPVVSPA